MVDRLVPCHVVLRHMYLTTFGVVLSINNLSLAQPRFASLQSAAIGHQNCDADADSLLCQCWKERGSDRKSLR